MDHTAPGAPPQTPLQKKQDNLQVATFDRGVASGAVIQRRLVTWGPDGTPIATSMPTLVKSQIEELVPVVLSLPFDDPLGLEPEFAGMTNAEVMMVKMARAAANGDFHLAGELLDRVLGRPKQSVESKSMRVTATYEDYLKSLSSVPSVPPAAPPAAPAGAVVERAAERDIFESFGDGGDGEDALFS